MNKRRYKLRLSVFIPRLILLACVVAGIAIGITHFPKAAEAFSGATNSETLVYNTPTPIVIKQTPTPTIAPQKPKATGFLVLVNWDNTINGERADGLVEISSVLGDEVIIVNAKGSINETAGRAASEMFVAAKTDGIGKFMITSAYR